MYNTITTAVAICTFACWEQDINLKDPKTRPLIELFFPYLYKTTQDEELFTNKKFFMWLVLSIIQSLVVFGLPVLAYQY